MRLLNIAVAGNICTCMPSIECSPLLGNFRGQVLPESKLISYVIELKRVREGKTVLGVADCEVMVDQKQIYTAEEVKVGLFTNLEGFG